MKNSKLAKRWLGRFLIFIGLLLSPLTPWNDIYVNMPVAYAFGIPFSLISEELFLPMTILGYWLSNILGFILMHYGYAEIKSNKYSFRKHWRKYLSGTTLYTILIAILIYFEILPSGQDIINLLSKFEQYLNIIF